MESSTTRIPPTPEQLTHILGSTVRASDFFITNLHKNFPEVVTILRETVAESASLTAPSLVADLIMLGGAIVTAGMMINAGRNYGYHYDEDTGKFW